MYVCICAAVTDRQITAAAKSGATVLDLQRELCVGRSCGKCLQETRQIVEEVNCCDRNSEPLTA